MALRSTVPQHLVPRDQAAVPRGLVVAMVAALMLGLAGVVSLGLMLRQPAPGTASAGGLTLKLQSAEWVTMEHSSRDGFQMPQQMMPGAPTHDQQRLAVTVEVRNPGTGTAEFRPDEFSVESGDGRVYPAVSENLSEGPLGPGLGIGGTISFDLSVASAGQADQGLFLLWSRAGTVARVPMTIGGAAPEHHH